MAEKRNLWLILAMVTALIQPGFGGMMYSVDTPDTGLASNSFVDIIYNDGTLWLAGGRGLSYSTDMGLSWYTRTTETNPGLSSDEPSALFGYPGRLWMAGSHFEMYDNINYPFGDGLSLSTDNGETWETFTPEEASGFAKLVYDIAGNETSTYAACFYGGLIVRHEPNETWEHLFYSPADSLDWVADQWTNLNTGRYYSCTVDTTHADTMVVYGGSANGINKFLYLPRRVKLGGRMIFDIVPVGDYVYLAHENGITQADTATLRSLYTAGTSNGLGSQWITKMAYFGGKLWAAAFDPIDSSGLGLYSLQNPDQEWTAIGASLSGPSDLWMRADAGIFEGPDAGVYDFKGFSDSTRSVFYIAAGDSGVFRSLDSGQTWNRFYIDPLDTDQTSPRNQVYSIDVTPDSLFLGTKAGLVIASYLEPFSIDYDTLVVFAESDTSGSFVSLVRHQDHDSASFTYVGLEPQTDSGSYCTIFLDPYVDPDDTTGTVIIRGTLLLYKARLNDMIISGEELSIMASDSGLYYSPNLPTQAYIFPYQVIDLYNGLTLDSYRYLSAQYIGDRLFVGSSGGYSYGLSGKSSEAIVWYIMLANTDPNKHDLAVARTYENSGLPGDWVVALDLQKFDTGAVLWAGCRRVPDTTDQYNSVGFSTDYGDSWHRVLINEQVWNFAFDRYGTAYAAASSGLYAASPSGGSFDTSLTWDDWERLAIIDPVTEDTIAAETEVFSVEVAEDILWVGTELGLARRHIDPDSSWSVIRTFKATESSDEVYAAPVPFSPLINNGRLSVHYHVDQSAEVTVEIYDFAMNLVRVLAENHYREGGGDYFETWDGYNGRGDMAAVGIYYIKVTYSTGELRWGRLAIIP